MPGPLRQRAFAFATAAHGAQLKKYTGEPYIEHLDAVARLIESVPHSDAMVAAGLLHDVLEDTPTRIDELRRRFGAEVARLVAEVTDVSRPGDGARAVRKAIDRAHVARASPSGKTIKLADLIDNTGSIVAHDPRFARVYLAEKALLLEVLGDGDRGLFAMAQELLAKSAAIIGLHVNCARPSIAGAAPR